MRHECLPLGPDVLAGAPAARAAKAAGVPVSCHTLAADELGTPLLDIFEDEGLDLRAVTIGHSNDSADESYLQRIAARGAMLGLDRYFRRAGEEELARRAGLGVKLSLLDAGQEIALRRRLPPGVRLYTGDDFHYDELIRGDKAGHSDALLGAFAASAAPAAAALHALDAGDLAGYQAAIGPAVALSRLIFEAPTFYYKVGIAFLAWLNGLQPEFAMVGGLQRHRSAEHLARVFELAAAAGVLRDPELAVGRMTAYLAGRA